MNNTDFAAAFRNPPATYRGAPFWAWNCRIDRETARQHIAYFKEMGFGGFHMHSRTGMDMPYMQEEFLALVRFCAEEARVQGLQARLYDEDRWPSGAAGGLVTCTPRYRERVLLLSPEHRTDDCPMEEAVEIGAPYYVASYRVALHPDGTLAHYARVSREMVGEGVVHAFCCTTEESPWFNNQTYLNTLDGAAVAAFLRETHDRYAAAVGDLFGEAVPSLFTDEPRPAFRRRLEHAAGQECVQIPWTPDLPDTYRAAYGDDLVEGLPEVFWDRPEGQPSPVRYRYHNHVTDRFNEAFIRPCGEWCRRHGLVFTGHLLGEDSLYTQTSAVGDVMRCYPAFALPGIDMLCNAVHLNTAKQAQSASRQMGAGGLMSELYGVTNWDFDFRGHKFQGDWQAALGVTLRVPHLSWTSMEGEAKRDYPASISYQSPWYTEYRWMEDHFARLNTALTRGEAAVSVGVIHPIESYWCRWGPGDTASEGLTEIEDRHTALTNWLLRGLVDFDFICEATLPTQGRVDNATLQVGKMAYDTVLVPGCVTLRATTLALLQEFCRQGGHLIFLGEPPVYVDALPSEEGTALCRQACRLPFTESGVLTALEHKRSCVIREESGEVCKAYVGQLRLDGEDRWLFLAPVTPPACPDVSPASRRVITLPGRWEVTLYDSLTGDIRPLAAELSPEHTRLSLIVYPQDSLLLRLTPARRAVPASEPAQTPASRRMPLPPTVAFTRQEPNVLLLDTACYGLDGEPLTGPEEILRLDNRIRARLGYPSRTNKFAQPWVTPEEPATHRVTLAYTVHSTARLEGLTLALERPEECTICWNGTPVSSTVTGWYVDRAIRTVALPAVEAGENTLTLCYPYGRRSGLEAVYLLGDFDVALAGTLATLHPPRRELGFGSITGQGMPFYGGNVEYHLPVTVPEDGTVLQVRVPAYRGALVGVALDGVPCGRIVTAPYTCTVEAVSAGEHTLTLTLYGNRYNTFGALHNLNTRDGWYGFMYWRSEGDAWCYEYRPRETGILASPTVSLSVNHSTSTTHQEG